MKIENIIRIANSKFALKQDKKWAMNKLVEMGYKLPDEVVYNLSHILKTCGLETRIIRESMDEDIAKILITESHNKVVIEIDRRNHFEKAIRFPKGGLNKEIQKKAEKRVRQYISELV